MSCFQFFLGFLWLKSPARLGWQAGHRQPWPDMIRASNRTHGEYLYRRGVAGCESGRPMESNCFGVLLVEMRTSMCSWFSMFYLDHPGPPCDKHRPLGDCRPKAIPELACATQSGTHHFLFGWMPLPPKKNKASTFVLKF
jgi:hypothetical protein